MYNQRMRVALSLAAALAAALTFIAAPAAAQSPPTVRCGSVVLRPRSLDASHRVFLGRVAFAGIRIHQTASVAGPLQLWSRIIVFIRPGRRPATIVVSPAWRSRVTLSWGGSGPVHTLHFVGCSSPSRWTGYAGGVFLREPACVPLVVSAGGRRTVVRLGVGRACSPTG